MALSNIGNFSRIILLAAVSGSVAGCGTTPAPQMGLISPQARADLAQVGLEERLEGEARLGPLDTISVNVFREPDLSASNVMIDPNGKILLPLIGTVEAAGKTSGELADEITQKLAGGYLVDPRVSVAVNTIVSRKITVEGAVEDPGMFDLPVRTRLSGALALADGPSRVAKLDQVVVFREGDDGMYVARFDYREVQAGTMIDPVLRPGDRIIVGTSGLSQAWQDFLRTVPLIAVFQRF